MLTDTPSSPTTGPNMGEPGSDNNIPVIVGTYFTSLAMYEGKIALYTTGFII